MRAIGMSALRQRLRMRALMTGASRRGLVPTSRMASAWSIPAIVALNRHDAGAPRTKAPPSWRQSRCGTPRSRSRSPRAAMASSPTRSPASPAVRSAAAFPSTAATASSATSQLTGSKRPSRRSPRSVEAADGQPVDREPRTVPDPFLVDRLVQPRQDAQHASIPRIDADG